MSFLPSATVVVLNFNGIEHLERCFDSLTRLDYPREKLRVLFADNDSTDGSVDFVRQRYPDFLVQINDLTEQSVFSFHGLESEQSDLSRDRLQSFQNSYGHSGITSFDELNDFPEHLG